MTDTLSQSLPPSRGTGETPRDSTDIVRQLQDRLLALGRDVDTLPAAEIEKTAKAISTLIASVEKADAFLKSRETREPIDGLSEPSRLDLLRKIKRMVDNGALNELADDANV